LQFLLIRIGADIEPAAENKKPTAVQRWVGENVMKLSRSRIPTAGPAFNHQAGHRTRAGRRQNAS